MTPLADVYNSAADWLSEHEHVKGSHFVYATGDTACLSSADLVTNRDQIIRSVSCCAAGAIFAAIVQLDLPEEQAYSELAFTAIEQADALLDHTLEYEDEDGDHVESLVEFNDTTGRTKEEVVHLLIELAGAVDDKVPA